MEDLKKLEDHKFDDLKAKLELEIDNLQKQLVPAKLELNDPEIKEEKKKNLEAEIELLDSEIVKREEQIKLIDAEVKHRANIRLLIENALKEFVIDNYVRPLGQRNVLRKSLGLLSDKPPGFMPDFSHGFSIVRNWFHGFWIHNYGSFKIWIYNALSCSNFILFFLF
mgnify:CR=1 FL=1